MFYIVTEKGHKIPVESETLESDEWIPFQQTVGLYSDNTVLKDAWILELCHRDYFAKKKDFELELVKELKYDHEPTKEEILWAMSAYGLTRGDIATIHKSYELDIDVD